MIEVRISPFSEMGCLIFSYIRVPTANKPGLNLKRHLRQLYNRTLSFTYLTLIKSDSFDELFENFYENNKKKPKTAER